MKIMVLAAHGDDEVLGCGGTLAKYFFASGEVNFVYYAANRFTDHVYDKVVTETLRSASAKACKILGFDCAYGKFDDEHLYLCIPELADSILDWIGRVEPDMLLIPYWNDMNADHKAMFDAARIATRRFKGFVLCYETLSSTNIPPNTFVPNVYSLLDREQVDLKHEAVKKYGVETADVQRNVSVVEALARLRGSEVCAEYAEAFICIRGMI